MNTIHFVVLNIFLICSGVQTKSLFEIDESYPRQIGEKCNTPENSSGQCALLKDCPDALQDVYDGKDPEICSFKGREPIICCLGKIVPSDQDLHISITNRSIGEECQIPVARSTKFIPGKCLILQDCTEALAGLSKGILPRICGYRGLEAVVCCPERITKNPMNKTQHISYPNRISKRKCAEYGKSVFKLVESPLLGMLGPEYINISTCESSVEPLIVGGIYARPKQFPHMALLGLETNNNEKKWMCSGSLISEKFVITAAHCTSVINRGEIKWVRLGDLDFASTRDDSQFADYSIVQIFRHPKYRRPVLYNDIALVEVDRPVEFNEYIRPACLYSGNDDQLDKLIISGWTFSPDIDGHLRQYSALKSVSHEKCTNIFRFIQRRLRNGISEETMICSEQAHNDACFISSGAALQIYNKDVYCMYDLVGISSYSRGFCISTPSIHTRISGYINWIESIVWPEVIQM